MAEIEYDSTGAPIPDGKYILTCKLNPIDPELLEGPTTTTIVLPFKDYPEGFCFFPSADNEEGSGSPIAFSGKHIEGHTEYYFLHNVLYMEMHPNTPEVVEALIKQTQRETRPTRLGYQMFMK